MVERIRHEFFTNAAYIHTMFYCYIVGIQEAPIKAFSFP